MSGQRKIGKLALFCASAIFALFIAVKCASAGGASPKKALDAFFRVYPMVRGSGTSWGKEPARLASVLSPSLRDLLLKAENAEILMSSLTPEQPWGVEGDIWTSLFEGADHYHIGQCQIFGTQAVCDVRLSYGEMPKANDEWTDQYVITRTNGRWALDDVRWGGGWEFMHKGTLRELLASEIREAANSVKGAGRGGK
jgi:hypothetical protein